MENDIRIVRLKDGTDVVSFIDFKEDYVILYDPLELTIQPYRGNQGHLVLMNWLPTSLITENLASLRVNDILMTMIPNDEMVEHYLKTLEKTKNINKVKDSNNLSDEDISMMMDVMEELAKSGKDLIYH